MFKPMEMGVCKQWTGLLDPPGGGGGGILSFELERSTDTVNGQMDPWLELQNVALAHLSMLLIN